MNEITLTQEEVKRLILSLEDGKACISEQVEKVRSLELQNEAMQKSLDAVYKEHAQAVDDLNAANRLNDEFRAMLLKIRQNELLSDGGCDAADELLDKTFKNYTEKPKDDHEVPRYADCHHFQVVMDDGCPWCLRSLVEKMNRCTCSRANGRVEDGHKDDCDKILIKEALALKRSLPVPTCAQCKKEGLELGTCGPLQDLHCKPCCDDFWKKSQGSIWEKAKD